MPPTDLIGTSLLNLLAPTVHGTLQDTLLTSDSRCCEAVGLRKDGTRSPSSCRAAAFQLLRPPGRVTAARPDPESWHRSVSRHCRPRRRSRERRSGVVRPALIVAGRGRSDRAERTTAGQNVLVMKHRRTGSQRTPAARADAGEPGSVVTLAGQSVHDIRSIVRHLHPHLLKQLGSPRALRASGENAQCLRRSGLLRKSNPWTTSAGGVGDRFIGSSKSV
jgi:hypothetical protein